METLNVFFERQKVGTLSNAPEGLIFRYAEDWLEAPESMPISLSLPLSPKPQEARAFFANLLPEGLVREYLCINVLRIDYSDDFALLKAIGGDCAGALSLYPEGETPPAEDGQYRLLAKQDLEEFLGSPIIPPISFLGKGERVRLSLAGAQDKILVAEFDGQHYLPLNGAASTHIVKPQSVRLKSLVENEAFCMGLASRMGLEVAPSGIIEDLDELAYKTSRYDREIIGPRQVKRLHQEDFCQALGVGYAEKYQDNRGPGLKECFDLLRRFSRTPVPDRQKLLKLVTFNYLVGNTDCHGKNLSLLYRKGGPVLAPAYDIVSGLVYPGFHDMAMFIGGAANVNQVDLEHWRALAEAIGMRPRQVLGELERMAVPIRTEAPAFAEEMVARYGEPQIVEDIADLIVKRSEKVLRQIGTTALSVDSVDEDESHRPR